MITAADILNIGEPVRKKPAPNRTRRQLDVLDAYFLTGGTLTVAEALDRFDIYALSQRIGQLIAAGKPVVKTRERTPGGALVKRYSYAIQTGLF